MKIMIVEDEKEIAEELKNLLENSGYQAQILKNFERSKEEILQNKPNLILLDINIPKINGEMLLKEIRKESNVPVIMLTSKTNEVDEVLSISYGADDYITKPYNPTILLLRIQNIFKRMDREYLTYDDIKVNYEKGTLTKNNKTLELTKNEMIIFVYLLKKREKIVSRDELMTELWDNDEYINDNALTVNISRLRSKLESFGIKDPIETKKKVGYKLLWN